MINKLTTQRVLSIDAFRGITILVMIFVNEVAGVAGIPSWMKHVGVAEDAMTFVDVVFPAFLFIVGMSIPFAVNNRLSKGDSFIQLAGHILWRTIGLLVLGLFMVNSEDDYNEAAMGMSIHVWTLLFYACAILVWNVYTFQQKKISLALKGIGIVGLIILAFIYRGGKDGTHHMEIGWWGILGLIGWAYLYASIIYLLLKGNIIGIAIMIAVCVLVYIICKLPAIHDSGWDWISPRRGHIAHTSIVLCGIVLSLIFFNQEKDTPVRQRFIWAGILAAVLFIVATILRPWYEISKIRATPSWCLYSAGICCVIFALLYWLIDLKQQNSWTAFVGPAAANPLLMYILPSIIYALMGLLHLSWPEAFGSGIPGIIWCMVYAVVLIYVVRGLNKLKIRLQL